MLTHSMHKYVLFFNVLLFSLSIFGADNPYDGFIPAKKQGDAVTISLPNNVEMELIYVSPGVFTMGSPKTEKDRNRNELKHSVTLTKGYWLGKHEVTQEQWDSIMGENPSFFKGELRPVENVSWNDCQEFIEKLNEYLNCGARLPTEAEWEYACRASSTGAYAREDKLEKFCWYSKNGNNQTHDVCTRLSNAWGFFDMHGNVWEWCQDRFGDYNGSIENDPIGVEDGKSRVIRGGSWLEKAQDCRSARRGQLIDMLPNGAVGFRVACTAKVKSVNHTTVSLFNDSSDEIESKQENVFVSAPTRQPVNGERRVITLLGGVTMELIYVAPGSFIMGSPKTEKNRDEDEIQHKVTLTKGYWLGKHEVTQAQWQSIMGENPSFFKGELRPVENVSWNDCQKFIGKINEKLGCQARLPTEAEWEYACRAKTDTPYHFGSFLNGIMANCDGECPYGTQITGPNIKETANVGSYSPNSWGFYDMHGNVWEWCQDSFEEYPNYSITDPIGLNQNIRRVVRGGGWYSIAEHCRSAYRGWNKAHNRLKHNGLRLAFTSLPTVEDVQ